METNKSQNQRTVTTEYSDMCLQLPIVAVNKANWRVVDVTARDSYLGAENRLPFADARDKVLQPRTYFIQIQPTLKAEPPSTPCRCFDLC